MSSEMVSYYKNRANEYEKVYLKPERQKDLLQLTDLLQKIFEDEVVFEIACGTGYWTERIAKTAKLIKATDINSSVLEIAKAKSYYPAQVTFEEADIFHLTNTSPFTSLFGGFIWSHIDLHKIAEFIGIVSRQVKAGGTIVFIDNQYVEGSSLPIIDKDSFGNTYQTRKLENGSTYKVLKNFPSKHQIEELLKDNASDIKFVDLEYYLVLQYKRR